MPRRGVRRFVLEVLFLAGVAAALTIADLRPAAVIVLMAVAWVIVALLEWAAWLGEPHYGRGLPPRYYVPHVALPPPRAVEQYRGGYPVLGLHDDEPTFVASTTEWAAELADWPALGPEVLEDTEIASPEDRVVRLPPPVHDLEETVAAEYFVAEPNSATPVEAAPEPAPEADRTPMVAEAAVAAAAAAAMSSAAAVPVVEPAVPPAPVVQPEPVPVVLSLPQRPPSTVLHRVDPLGGQGRGRFRRRYADDEDVVEVHDGPPPNRVLPTRVQDDS